MKKFFGLDRVHRKLYVKLCVFSMLYILPIALADIYYFDDMARTYYGVASWNGDGRPLAEELMLLVCGGLPITDIAPLPLILSVFVLSYALVIYTREKLTRFSESQIVVVVLLSIITNPFAMANLSYRFDCIFMFIALSVPFLIFSLPNSLSCAKVFGLSILGCLFMMSMYQPAVGMCCVLFLISLALCFLFDEKDNFSFLRELCRMGGLE